MITCINCNIYFRKKILPSLYNTLILPQINYYILLWGKESKSILLLQKRARRAVSSAGFRSHSEPLFKIHNVLKVDDIYSNVYWCFTTM